MGTQEHEEQTDGVMAMVGALAGVSGGLLALTLDYPALREWALDATTIVNQAAAVILEQQTADVLLSKLVVLLQCQYDRAVDDRDAARKERDALDAALEAIRG